MQDYLFEEGPADLGAGDKPIRSVHLSELFTGPDRSLVIYHFMYGKNMTRPCPMCTLFIDWNGIPIISRPRVGTIGMRRSIMRRKWRWRATRAAKKVPQYQLTAEPSCIQLLVYRKEMFSALAVI